MSASSEFDPAATLPTADQLGLVQLGTEREAGELRDYLDDTKFDTKTAFMDRYPLFLCEDKKNGECGRVASHEALSRTRVMVKRLNYGEEDDDEIHYRQ